MIPAPGRWRQEDLNQTMPGPHETLAQRSNGLLSSKSKKHVCPPLPEQKGGKSVRARRDRACVPNADRQTWHAASLSMWSQQLWLRAQHLWHRGSDGVNSRRERERHFFSCTVTGRVFILLWTILVTLGLSHRAEVELGGKMKRMRRKERDKRG